MPEPDAAELLKDLKVVSANIGRHIKEEGQKVGAALGKTYTKAADDRIRDNAAEMQRLQDLVAEFRRQREPLERAADKSQRIATVVRRAHWAGEEAISVKALMDIINEPEREQA